MYKHFFKRLFDFVLAGIDEKNLMRAVEVAVIDKNGCKPVDVYADTNVSDRVKENTVVCGCVG